MGGTKALVIPTSQRLGQLHTRLAAYIVERLHARPGHGTMHTQAYCLGKGFLGREPSSQETHTALGVPLVARVGFLDFLGPEYALNEFFTVALEYLLDAVDFQQVDPNARDLAFRCLNNHLTIRIAPRRCGVLRP